MTPINQLTLHCAAIAEGISHLGQLVREGQCLKRTEDAAGQQSLRYCLSDAVSAQWTNATLKEQALLLLVSDLPDAQWLLAVLWENATLIAPNRLGMHSREIKSVNGVQVPSITLELGVALETIHNPETQCCNQLVLSKRDGRVQVIPVRP